MHRLCHDRLGKAFPNRRPDVRQDSTGSMQNRLAEKSLIYWYAHTFAKAQGTAIGTAESSRALEDPDRQALTFRSRSDSLSAYEAPPLIIPRICPSRNLLRQ